MTAAKEVHHKKELEEYPELGLDIDNLESLCHDCHEQTKYRREAGVPDGVRVIKA